MAALSCNRWEGGFAGLVVEARAAVCASLDEASRCLPSLCASVFIAFLIWFPGRMGLAGMKNEEVKERREVVWQVAFCPCQLVADPSRSWTLGPQLCECRFSGWLWL